MPNIELQSFMVFNSGEGQGEGREGDKLIFHWNKDSNQLSQTEQINDICLCDACINVSDRLNENFDITLQEGLVGQRSKKKKSLILKFEHSVIVVLQVEPDDSIWMAAKVVVESDHEGSSTRSGDLSSSNIIPAEAIKSLVNSMYSRFCLLKGSFRMIIDEIKPSSDIVQIREKLRLICREYFGQVLKSMHLSSILSNETALYNNLAYIDLNPLTNLKVISFTNHLVCMSATKIRHTLVIFNDQLLWSSLTLLDTRLIFNYLVSVLIKSAVQEELSKEVDKVRRIKENFPIHLTEAIVERTASFTDGTELPQPKVEEEEETTNFDELQLTKYYLTVFRSSNLTLGLILDEPNLADPIENTITSALAALARHVGQDYIEVMRKQKSSSKTTKRTP